MSEINIVPTLGSLGPNPCYFTEEDRYRAYMRATAWKIPLGITAGIILSDQEPSVEDRDKLWYKLGSDAAIMLPAPYVYSPIYAMWVAKHPATASTNKKFLWGGTPAALETLDGGVAGAVTPTTGPFWEVDTVLADKIPIGVGTLIPVVGDLLEVFDDATPGPPELVGLYYIKRTARLYWT